MTSSMDSATLVAQGNEEKGAAPLHLLRLVFGVTLEHLDFLR